MNSALKHPQLRIGGFVFIESTLAVGKQQKIAKTRGLSSSRNRSKLTWKSCNKNRMRIRHCMNALCECTCGREKHSTDKNRIKSISRLGTMRLRRLRVSPKS